MSNRVAFSMDLKDANIHIGGKCKTVPFHFIWQTIYGGILFLSDPPARMLILIKVVA